MQPRDDQPARLPRPWGRVSTIRLETFSDGVFAIAVTLLALQLHPPNLGEATTAGAVLHALGQEARPFGFYTLAFLLTGRLWIEHHQLLDPLETHGRHLAGTNLWFLFTVSLLPYWVSVMATYPHNSAAGGLFVLAGCSCYGWGWRSWPSCWCVCWSDESWPAGPPSTSSSCPR